MKSIKLIALSLIVISCQKTYVCTATKTEYIFGDTINVNLTKELKGKQERDNFIEQNENQGAVVNCK